MNVEAADCPSCGAEPDDQKTGWRCGSYRMHDGEALQSESCYINVLEDKVARLREAAQFYVDGRESGVIGTSDDSKPSEYGGYLKLKAALKETTDA